MWMNFIGGREIEGRYMGLTLLHASELHLIVECSCLSQFQKALNSNSSNMLSIAVLAQFSVACYVRFITVYAV